MGPGPGFPIITLEQGQVTLERSSGIIALSPGMGEGKPRHPKKQHETATLSPPSSDFRSQRSACPSPPVPTALGLVIPDSPPQESSSSPSRNTHVLNANGLVRATGVHPGKPVFIFSTRTSLKSATPTPALKVPPGESIPWTKKNTSAPVQAVTSPYLALGTRRRGRHFPTDCG